MVGLVRSWLRQQRYWVQFQELRREGFRAAWRRRSIQRQILPTPPIRTANSGPVEVRVLTWRRDWINMIWALKSFYHFAQVDYPLFIHDGGLLPDQVNQLQHHFPDAKLILSHEADQQFPAQLHSLGLSRSVHYRAKNISMRKIYDYVLDSHADYFVTIDSDIVFFRKPERLVLPSNGITVNRYNLDDGYWYSLPLDELEQTFGVRPPAGINSGLALIRRESLDLKQIEGFLAHPPMYENNWVTEQTLHALCSTLYGVELLPDTYRVGGPLGITPDLVCKHYPGTHRPWLYTEGMQYLIDHGFLDQVGRS